MKIGKKKLAIVSVLFILFAMVPIYAQDSNSTNAMGNNQLIKHPFKFLKLKCHELKNKIEALKTSDPAKYQQIVDIKSKIKQNHDQIKTLRQQNKTGNQAQIQDLINQNKDLKNQIRTILGK